MLIRLNKQDFKIKEEETISSINKLYNRSLRFQKKKIKYIIC